MDLFNSAINHLEQLVSFDTSNPPRAISESGLLDYLESIAGQNLSISDHGNGSYNCLIQQGNPKHLINVHLDTVPAGDGWETDPFKLHKQNDVVHGLGACDIKGAAAALLSLIESLTLTEDNALDGFLQVQHVIRPKTEEFHDYRGFAGKVKSGVFSQGDEIEISWVDNQGNRDTKMGKVK